MNFSEKIKQTLWMLFAICFFDKPLLAAATGAIWKCSNVIFENAKPQEIIIDESGAESTKETPTQGLVGLLASLMEDQPEEILINVSGTLYIALRTDLQCYVTIVKRANISAKCIALLKRDSEVSLICNNMECWPTQIYI